MKKLISISFVLFILYYTAGYYVVFMVKQYQVKKEVKRMLKQQVSQGELTLFKIVDDHNVETGQRIHWMHKGEFKLGQSLFDIVRKEVKGDTLLLQCINDRQEAELFAELDEHVAMFMKEKSGKNGGEKSASKILPKDIFYNEYSVDLFTFLPPRLNLYSYSLSDFYHHYVSIPTPPPNSLI